MNRVFPVETEVALRLGFKSVIMGPDGVEGLIRSMAELNACLMIAAEVLKEHYDEQEKK